ncbi:MAG TPA: uroporphyrinogen decarboxylase family protein [Armatimonadota bacterium]|nr:uroporphyrinogen decarboxylase family protein [Armatimonadota bacterium]HOS43941.1 uroporphyrinogen decarboxylase family protein [Armatimonadota bacterium]
MMTPRENLLRLLRRETPAWIPIVAHVDPYNQPNRSGMDPALAAKLGEVRWGDEATVTFSRYFGLDIMDFCMPPLVTTQRAVTVETAHHDGRLITRWRTRNGELREVKRYAPDTGMWYTEEHMVKDADDLPRLAELFADQEYAYNPDGVAMLRARQALIGDDGLLQFALPGTPLGQMIRVHAGVETTALLWADARAELHALFAVMEEAHVRQFALTAALEFADCLLTMDDTSTTAISPAMFAEFCLGYTDRLADVVHAAGKFYFHHSCGLIRDLLPLYRQTKMDAVHAYTCRPLGDVTIADRTRLGPRISIIAGMIQMFGNMDDRGAVAESVAQMFAEAAPGDQVIFSLAADPEKTMDETAFLVACCQGCRRQAAK